MRLNTFHLILTIFCYTELFLLYSYSDHGWENGKMNKRSLSHSSRLFTNGSESMLIMKTFVIRPWESLQKTIKAIDI